ncbi:hypothetical protein NDU88_006228 [Pleurodeles waltl]|uniref:Uncharacterized protein n=1 Tax=Pleurodeles waltl TaxID=8319 RepID=A0AAV7TWI7_PLEWA|nr:hypothetical protein NDU88_006228 [Pleurodeles waltl]
MRWRIISGIFWELNRNGHAGYRERSEAKEKADKDPLKILNMVVVTRKWKHGCEDRGLRDSAEVWRQRRSKDGAEQGALSVFVYCRDQALSVSVRRALSVSVYRRDSRIE